MWVVQVLIYPLLWYYSVKRKTWDSEYNVQSEEAAQEVSLLIDFENQIIWTLESIQSFFCDFINFIS